MTQSEPTMTLSAAFYQVNVTVGQAAEILQALAWGVSDPVTQNALRTAAGALVPPEADTPLASKSTTSTQKS